MTRAESLVPVLTDAAVRGAFVLSLALVLAYCMRKRTAAARHLVWVGAIAIQLVLPAFARWGPTWGVELPTAVVRAMPEQQSSTGPSLRSGRQSEVRSGRQHQDDVILTDTRSASKGSAPLTATQGMIAVWAIGAFLIFARLAIGTAFVAVLARRGARVDDRHWISLMRSTSAALRINRPLTLLRGDTLGVPVTWGILRPVVLLPADSGTWPDERRRLVLVHELAHVIRLDALTQLVGQIALALFWFDPLVWIANRRMQIEREHACDDCVIRFGAVPSLYAEELLSMVQALGARDMNVAQPAFAALAMARRSEIEGRMLSILDPVLNRRPLNRKGTLVGALAAACLVLPLAAFHPYQRPASPAPVATRPSSPAPIMTALDTLTSRKVKTTMTPLATIEADKLDTAASAFVRGVRAASCDQAHLDGSTKTSFSVHSDDDGGASSSMEFLRVTKDRCASASIVGAVKYSAEEDDVVSVPPGASASFRERTPSFDRELDITPGADGALVRVYRRNGAIVTYDAEARAWFAVFLPAMLSETGVNAVPRIARWMSVGGGMENTFAHIAAMSSSSARRRHYEAMIDSQHLNSAQMLLLVREAARTLRESSSDMRAILTRTAASTRENPGVAQLLEQALTNMASSSDKTAILQEFGESRDRSVLIAVVRLSQTIASDGDKARLLVQIQANALSLDDPIIQDEFIRSASSIASSSALSRVIVTAGGGARSENFTRGLIEASRRVSGSSDRARALIAILNSGAVKNDPLRASLLAAAREVPGDSDRARVLDAIARR